MIETPILTLTYDLPTLDLAQQLYKALKARIGSGSTRIKSAELVHTDYLIYVDGVYFNNTHIPHNEYSQKGGVRITVAPEDKTYGLLFLKELASEILPEFMKPYGVVISVGSQTIVSQNLI